MRSFKCIYIICAMLALVACSHDDSFSSGTSPLIVKAGLSNYSAVSGQTRYYTINNYYDIPAEGEDTLLLRDFTKISNKGVLRNLGLLIIPSLRAPQYNVLFTTDIVRYSKYQWENNLFSHVLTSYLPSIESSKWGALTTPFEIYQYDVDPTLNDSVYVFGVSDGQHDVVFGAGKREDNFYEFSVKHQGAKLCVLLYNGAKVNPLTPELTYAQQLVWLSNYKEMSPGLAFVKDGSTYNYVVPDSYEEGLAALPDNALLSGAKAVIPTWTPKGTVNDSLPIPFVQWGNWRAYIRLIAPQSDISNVSLKVLIPMNKTLDQLAPQIYTLPLTDIVLDNGTNLTEIAPGKLYYIKVYVSLLEGVTARGTVMNWNQASTSTNIEMAGTGDAFVSK